MYTKPMPLDRGLDEEIPIHPLAQQHKDAFGIEIELEGLNIRTEKPNVRKLWGMHEDGSLRAQIAGRAGGVGQTCEYVSITPLTEEQALESLKTLFDFLTSPDVTVFPSYRTSIHVHVNCARETWRTIYNYITLAIIFDELFVSQSGEHRIGNNFCLRFVDAEAPVEELAKSIAQYGNLKGVPQHMRYSSTNFASLYKFGTVEFRSMECHTDFERVKKWIKTLQKLKESAREFRTPQDIINLFSQYNETEFGVHILGKDFTQFVETPDYKKMLRRGMRLAQDFAYASTWEAQTKATELEQRAEYEKQMAAMKKKVAKQALQWAEPGVPQPMPMPNFAIPVPPVGFAGGAQLGQGWAQMNQYIQADAAMAHINQINYAAQPQPEVVDFDDDEDHDVEDFDEDHDDDDLD